MAGLAQGKEIGRKKRNTYENLFFILLVLTGGFILLNSSLFDVSRVLVRGNHFMEEEKIRTVADIGQGTNIFKVNLNAAAGGVKLLPMIKDVKVKRSLPSTIVIEVTERKPLGLLPTAEGFIEVDRDGVYLKKTGVGLSGLPVVTGIQTPIPNPGEPVQAGRLSEALGVIDGLPEDAVSILSEVNISENGQVTMYTLDNIQCRFGMASEAAEKGRVLVQILKEIQSRGEKIQYIDLSCASSPVVYYKHGTKGGAQ